MKGLRNIHNKKSDSQSITELSIEEVNMRLCICLKNYSIVIQPAVMVASDGSDGELPQVL